MPKTNRRNATIPGENGRCACFWPLIWVSRFFWDTAESSIRVDTQPWTLEKGDRNLTGSGRISQKGKHDQPDGRIILEDCQSTGCSGRTFESSRKFPTCFRKLCKSSQKNPATKRLLSGSRVLHASVERNRESKTSSRKRTIWTGKRALREGSWPP